MKRSNPVISACILARNEERRIEDALKSLQGWTDQIIVIDNESDDNTVEIARRYTSDIFSTPRSANFDAARNLAIEHATGDWIFYLDADERVPPALGRALRQRVEQEGEEFEALLIPFKHYFCGKWMEHSGWWPGYTRPQLLKKGRFRYNERLHKGIEVEGRTRFFPADDPELAIVHYSYDDLRHYLTKLNNYTDGEAENLLADNQRHTWQAMLAHFVHDWQIYYERGRADLDGMHGFVLAFMSAFYRFASRAKLWDARRKRGEVMPGEPVPASLREMLEFMARVTQEGAAPWLQPAAGPVEARAERVPLLWCAPFDDPSGYADEARNFVLGLIEAGEEVVVAPMNWGQESAELAPEVKALLTARIRPWQTPAEIFISQTTPPLNRPSPHARFSIARTMFETDRLLPGWEQILNAMDRIWVPSEFNRDTFVRSGVDPDKVAVVPGALDAARFMAPVDPWPIPAREPFVFLSVFDWTLHKGWDVLLEAFAREFGDEPERVGLLLKVWSSNHYTLDAMRAQADALLHATVGKPLEEFPNIYLWQERLPVADLPRLYRAVHAYVTPTRGEGWGRPLMEAMAAGLPTLATAWSGLTAFHNERVGYPLKYRLAPVSAEGAKEIPIYTGQYWAEPDRSDLCHQMRQIVSRPEPARKRGLAGQRAVSKQFSRAAVAQIVREELALCRQLAAAKAERAEPVSPADAGGRNSAAQRRAERPPANLVPLDPPRTVRFRETLGRPLRVRWEGDQAILSSLAHVNRELCLGLIAEGDIELSLVPRFVAWDSPALAQDARLAPLLACRDEPLSGPPDVTIRHHFPPNWQRPASGKLVVMQPWEYGHLPQEWVEGARQADEVWAYSRFVRNIYVRSGVPAEKVRLVPLGVRSDLFTPEGDRTPLPTTKSCRLLFVGGALHRKGADLLLQAYRQAFTAHDDVCLIVKDMGTRTFYTGQTLAPAYRQAAADASGPEVLYLDDDLTEAQLASLYRACTCVVLPYRGEGFGLPPLEGMACGLPAIVTAGGPTDDYLDDGMALRVPYQVRSSTDRRVGSYTCVGDVWYLEPDRDALAAALRWVFDHPEETRTRGRASREHVLAGWTWERATALARERLHLLTTPARRQSVPPARLWAEPATPVAVNPSATQRVAPEEVEISLCLIARNEEQRIGDCLTSIAPYVDEMIVVDTGSEDRTREIALACGARVFDFPWTDSFAEARNQSLAQARGKWIFWMDADDVISPECGQQLRELIRQHPDWDVAYQVQVRIPPGPGEFSVSLVDHVKLFPNRSDLQFEHRIHEQILPSLRRAGLSIRFSDLYVTHVNYDRSPEGQARKRQRDFRLLELDLIDHPNHPFVLFNLGMTYLYATQEYAVAAHYLRRSIDGSHWADSIVRKAYALLTAAYICRQEWPAAIAANEEGRGYYPHDAELLFQAGQIYQQLDRFDEARSALERLMSEPGEPEHYRSVDAGLRTYRGRHELALLYRRMGDIRHCEQVLREIIAEQPGYLPARVDLAEQLAAAGNLTESRALQAGLARHASSRPTAYGLPDPTDIPIREPDWHAAPAFGRRETLLATLRLLNTLYPGPVCIVETGTLRNESANGLHGDGWSTIAWGWYASQTGGRVLTVDVRAEALHTCRLLTAPYVDTIDYIQSDSIAFLERWDADAHGKIHLLYLDSLDYELGEQSERHSLAEAQAALASLAAPCLVLFDDTEMAPVTGTVEHGRCFTGKGAQAVPYLLSNGFRLEWSRDKQTLLSRSSMA